MRYEDGIFILAKSETINKERINARKRNTINIAQCSKSSKSMILSKFIKDNFHIIEMSQNH